MNILLITKNYPPAICGVGDHSWHLKREWEQMGHKVWVLTTTPGISDEVIYTQSFGYSLKKQLREVVCKHKIDLLFWQYVPYSYQAKGLPFWWPGVMKNISQMGIRQRIYFHEVSLRRRGDGLRQSIWATLQQRIAESAHCLADRNFTSITLYQSYFKKVVPEIVPVGSNLPKPSGTIPIRNNNIVCFANRADEALLNAVKSLRMDLPVTLTLCGAVDKTRKTKMESWLDKQYASDWIKITGVLNAEELAACIAGANVFIQPQVTDKNGRGGISAKNGTVMAAMCFGRPILTCKGDMTDDSIFRDQENVMFFPYGDSSAYLAVLKLVLEDAEFADRLGKAAATIFKEKASWPQIASKLIR